MSTDALDLRLTEQRPPLLGRLHTTFETLTARLFAPIDIAILVYFRVAFGLLMLWEIWRYFDRGWIAASYIDPVFNFTYAGFSWVQPWPGNGMYIHFAILGVCALCITLGLFYRLSAALFFLGYTYAFLLEQTAYNNHYYLIGLLSFLMVFVPAHRALSIDSWLRPSLRAETAPAWSLWALRAQVAIPYFYGGLAKLSPDWINGQPMRMWLADTTDFPLVGRWFTQPLAPYVFSWGGLLLDLFIVPALLWRRTRTAAFVLVVFFHVTNAWLFPIGIFPPLMIAATAIFFDPSWPRFGGLWQPSQPLPPSAPPPRAGRLSSARRLTLAFLAVYFAVQLLIPLRHYALPGNVLWTDEGFDFAWHMRVRDKWGNLTYSVRDPVSGQTWAVNPADELDAHQYDVAASDTDMILQYAHHLADRWRDQGFPDVQVFAHAEASLNGRPLQPFIDPTVDLAVESRHPGPADWILPLDEPLSR